MTEREALVNAVVANPAPDLPRLVYADWLDEHGEPEWANVIRVMCEVPHEFDAEVQVERMGLARSEPGTEAVAAWLASHAPHHLSQLLGGRRCEPLPNDWVWRTWCPALDLRVEWCRGFIAVVRGPIETVRRYLRNIAKAHPVERAEAADRRPTSSGFLSDTDGVFVHSIPAALYQRSEVGNYRTRFPDPIDRLSALLLDEARGLPANG